MPPSLAIAIAARCSVTVSIAADTKGIFKEIFFVSIVFTSTSLGKTSEYLGTNNISSNVRAFFLIFIAIPFFEG